MRIVDRFVFVLLRRWPVILVAPASAYAGYTFWQVIVLTVLVIVLAEVAFAFVSVMLFGRE